MDFTNVRTSFLADNPRTDWPPNTYLSDFAYEEFAPIDINTDGQRDPEIRARWLARLEPHEPPTWLW